MHDDAWNATFESLMDSLFSVLMNPGEPFHLKETCFGTLTEIINKQPRERFS